VIRYGNTLPNWIADTSKISPQNPIIHRANPILQLALNKEIEASRLSCLKPNSSENHAGIEVPART
jgi:hypothetical protein